VAPGLAERFRVLAYDRRGYSRSERPDSAGSVDEDGDDLAALLEALELARARGDDLLRGNSRCASLPAAPSSSARCAAKSRPSGACSNDDAEAQEIFAADARSIEPIARRIAEGDHARAARQFVEEVIMGPGAWDNALPAETRAIMVQNAPTFLDELQDPNANAADADALATLDMPVRLTEGTESPPILARVIDRLVDLIPGATRELIDGAGHVPQLTTPERYVAATTRAAQRASA